MNAKKLLVRRLVTYLVICPLLAALVVFLPIDRSVRFTIILCILIPGSNLIKKEKIERFDILFLLGVFLATTLAAYFLKFSSITSELVKMLIVVGAFVLVVLLAGKRFKKNFQSR